MPLLSVRVGIVVGFATDMSAFEDDTFVTVPVPEIAISPLPRSDIEFIVFIFVPETRVACFPESPGTVGLSAVPQRSPVSLSLPFTELVASGVAPPLT